MHISVEEVDKRVKCGMMRLFRHVMRMDEDDFVKRVHVYVGCLCEASTRICNSMRAGLRVE